MKISIELGKARQDKTCAVYLRVASGNTKKRLNTGVVLCPKDYSQGKSGLRIKNLDKKGIIDTAIREVEQQYSKSLTSLKTKATAEEVINAVAPEKKDFFAFAEKWLSTCKLKSKKNYVTAVKNFQIYVNKETLAFADITVSLLRGYEDSLEDKPRAQTQYTAAIRHLWNEAERIYDDLPKSPYIKYTPKKQRPVGQRATDIETIRKIYEYQGTGRAMLARDCFILSFCLMGINSVDLYNCTDLKDDVLSYDRTKVRDRRIDRGHTEVNIHPFIKRLVKKYRSRGQYVFDFHTRYCDYQNFNKYLNKGLKKILGDKSTVTFYSARHAWATIARNNLSIDKYTVNEALVHVDEEMKVTDLYIKKDYTIINDVNKKVIEFVFAPYL